MLSQCLDIEPLDNFNEEQLAKLDESINTLDQEDQRWSQEQREVAGKRVAKLPFQRLRKSLFEIINRLLFFLMILAKPNSLCFDCFTFPPFILDKI